MNSLTVGFEREERILSSARWAAYGDAIGFPTELADASLVKRRVGKSRIDGLIPWTRRVGGRFGVDVRIPLGGYSDDTQLRLATSRAIRGDGVFDVETFAKIELPVWLSYCLGAGKGSKAAAANLANKRTNWFSNFFSMGGANYFHGGGNGAAMRIQPHVWASPEPSNWNSFLPQVAKNAICTHGHVRGIGGALVHAAMLAHVLEHGALPALGGLQVFAAAIESLPRVVRDDKDLSQFWLPVWEERSGSTLQSAVDEVSKEWTNSCEEVQRIGSRDPSELYFSSLNTLGGLSEKERGSGIKCALFAAVGATFASTEGAERAMSMMANVLGSDTDTIASMAGALMGACRNQSPPVDRLQDQAYIDLEARRCLSISQGESVPTFAYPDLLYWNPPKSPLDVVGRSGSAIAMAGLGVLKPLPEFPSHGSKDTSWRWFELPFGQRVLCRHRIVLPEVSGNSLPGLAILQRRPEASQERQVSNPQGERRDLFSKEPILTKSRSVDDLVNEAIRSGFEASTIGNHVIELSRRNDGIELCVAYVAIVAKARSAREKAQK